MSSIIPLLVIGVGLCFLLGFAGLVLMAVLEPLRGLMKKLLGRRGVR